MAKRKQLTDKERLEIIEKCSNSCCVCQTPFIQVHHIDGDSSNNDPDNLAPLCPNCHNIAHSCINTAHTKVKITMQLSQDRIKKLRDIWYNYCEERKLGTNFSAIAKLKIKNFVRSLGPYGASHGWAKTFASVDPSYKTMKVDEIIDAIFSTTNPDDILTYLETMKKMYQKHLSDQKNLKEFKSICNAFGTDYGDLN